MLRSLTGRGSWTQESAGSRSLFGTSTLSPNHPKPSTEPTV
jgi:hypothetical protein